MKKYFLKFPKSLYACLILLFLLIIFGIGSTSYADNRYVNTLPLKLKLDSQKAKMMFLSTKNITPTVTSPSQKDISTGWVNYNTSYNWPSNYVVTEGQITIYCWYMDYAGNISVAASDTVTYDPTPATGTLVINGGKTSTNESTVTLTLTKNFTCADVDKVWVSNKSDFSTYIEYSYPSSNIIANWELDTSTLGSKTIYVKYIDLASNEYTFSNSITYNGPIPGGTLVINNGVTATQTADFKLVITAYPLISPYTTTDMLVTEDNKVPLANDSRWEKYLTKRDYQYDGDDGKVTIKVWFKSSTQNVSSLPASAEIICDRTPPIGQLYINGGAASTNQSTVNLSFDASDESTSVEKMMISNNSSFTGAVWEPYTNTRADWSIDSGTNGLKNIYVKFMDSVGNISNPVSSSITYADTSGGGSALLTGYMPYSFLNSVHHYQILTYPKDSTDILMDGPEMPAQQLNEAQYYYIKAFSTFFNNDRVRYRIEFDVTDANASLIKDMDFDLDLNNLNEEDIFIILNSASLKKYINGSFQTIKVLYPKYLGPNRYTIGIGNDDQSNPMISINGGGKYCIEYTGRIKIENIPETTDSRTVDIVNQATISIYAGEGGFTQFYEPRIVGRQFDVITRVSTWFGGLR